MNVGHAKRVSMSALRTLLAKQGFQDVRTLLNSGNVIFTASSSSSSAHAARIQSLILSDLRVATDVLVVSSQFLSSVAAENPFASVATATSVGASRYASEPRGQGFTPPVR